MGIPSTLFLILATFLSVFVSTTSFASTADISARIFQWLFLPVTIYLVISTIGNLFYQFPALNRSSGWRRLAVYYSFIISSSLVIVSFLASQTIPQIISALIFSPIAIYFFILVLPKKNYVVSPISAPPHKSIVENEKPSPPSKAVDFDRRDFLKLIGTAGIAAFVFNLFSKKSNVPFFGQVANVESSFLKDSGGNKIDPAEKSPTDGYYISQIDDLSEISYFGFINRAGQWFIMRQDFDKSFRYAKGDSNFSVNWEKRDSFDYDYFDNVF